MVTNWVKSSTRIQRHRGVLDLPDHDGRDLDRVALGIVDFRLGRFLVADPSGYLAPSGERVDPLQAGVPDRPAVPAEQLDRACLARDDRRQTPQRKSAGDEKQRTAHFPRRWTRVAALRDALDEHCDRTEQQDNAYHQHRHAARHPCCALDHPTAWYRWGRIGCIVAHGAPSRQV